MQTCAKQDKLQTAVQVFCSKRNPNCSACPLRSQCEYARANGAYLRRAVPPQSTMGEQVHPQARRGQHDEQQESRHMPAQGQTAEPTKLQPEHGDQQGLQGHEGPPQAGVPPTPGMDALSPGPDMLPDHLDSCCPDEHVWEAAQQPEQPGTGAEQLPMEVEEASCLPQLCSCSRMREQSIQPETGARCEEACPEEAEATSQEEVAAVQQQEGISTSGAAEVQEGLLVESVPDLEDLGETGAQRKAVVELAPARLLARILDAGADMDAA